MRQYILASHGGFSKGIYESIKIIVGEQVNVHLITAFIDGNNDIEMLVKEMFDSINEDDEIIVCSDVFGGSVNNEFMKYLGKRKYLYLITGMNLPLLMQLFLSVEEDTDKMIKEIVYSEDTKVKYCNEIVKLSNNQEDDF